MHILSTNRNSLRCLVTLMLLYAARCAPAQGAVQTIRLTQDSSIKLLGWSYGKYHALVQGRESRHTNIIPSDRPDPNEIASCETEENALVFWVKRTGPAAQRDRLSIRPDWTQQQVRAADEYGHEITSTVAHWRMNRTENPGALTDEPIAITAFPRRGITVILRVYSPGATKVLGEFRIPNPVRKPPPLFAVDRFPVTRTSGDLQLTLAPVIKGNPRHFLRNDGKGDEYSDQPHAPTGFRSAPEESRRMESHATFTYRGKPSTHWIINAMIAEMWDGSGNRLEPDLAGAGNDKLCYLAPNIGEPVRLRIGAFQKSDREFVPDRIWLVPGVTVPAPGAVTLVERGIHMDDFDLRLVGIAGAGVNQFGRAYFSPAPPGFVAVVLRSAFARQSPDFKLRISDAHGRPILPSDPLSQPGFFNIPGSGRSPSPWFGSGGSIGPETAEADFMIKVPPGSGKIDLIFGLNRTHIFEFILPVSVRQPSSVSTKVRSKDQSAHKGRSR